MTTSEATIEDTVANVFGEKAWHLEEGVLPLSTELCETIDLTLVSIKSLEPETAEDFISLLEEKGLKPVVFERDGQSTYGLLVTYGDEMAVIYFVGKGKKLFARPLSDTAEFRESNDHSEMQDFFDQLDAKGELKVPLDGDPEEWKIRATTERQCETRAKRVLGSLPDVTITDQGTVDGIDSYEVADGPVIQFRTGEEGKIVGRNMNRVVVLLLGEGGDYSVEIVSFAMLNARIEESLPEVIETFNAKGIRTNVSAILNVPETDQFGHEPDKTENTTKNTFSTQLDTAIGQAIASAKIKGAKTAQNIVNQMTDNLFVVFMRGDIYEFGRLIMAGGELAVVYADSDKLRGRPFTMAKLKETNGNLEERIKNHGGVSVAPTNGHERTKRAATIGKIPATEVA